MKKYTIILFILFFVNAHASNYYVSASGSDANAGTSTSAPWLSIGKVNATTLVAGDIVSFNGGDTFYGNLIISQSGSAGNNITYNSYGTGKAIISGFTTLTGWSAYNSNINQVALGNGSIEMVTVNGVPTGRGRWPNTGFNTYNVVTSQSAISDASLTGTPNWAGAELVMRKSLWTLSRDSITTQSTSTLNFVAGSNWETMVSGYGYFIQNSLTALDQIGEWYSGTNNFYMWFGGIATSNYVVKAAAVKKVISMDTHDYLTFDNLQIQGADSIGMYVQNSGHVTISNCDLNYMGKYGIYMGYQTNNVIVTGCTFNNTYDNAIFVNGAGTDWITNNYIKNTGLIMGTGVKGAGVAFDNNGDAVVIYPPYVTFSGNIIDSSGHTGVRIGNTYDSVYNNVVNHSGMIRDDVGGIYAWNGSKTMTGSCIENNVVLNTVGNRSGILSTEFVGGEGIYLDYVTGVSVLGNTVGNSEMYGYLINGSENIEMHDNTSYNARNFGLQINERAGDTAQNINVSRNSFIAKDSSNTSFLNLNSGAFLFYSDLSSSSLLNFGAVDSNYYARPVDDNLTIMTYLNGVYNSYSLSGWKTASGKDSHTSGTPKAVNSTSVLKFMYNPNNYDSTGTLPNVFLDVKNKSYYWGNIVLPPYSSAVLIDNNNTLPVNITKAIIRKKLIAH